NELVRAHLDRLGGESANPPSCAIDERSGQHQLSKVACRTPSTPSTPVIVTAKSREGTQKMTISPESCDWLGFLQSKKETQLIPAATLTLRWRVEEPRAKQ